MAATSSSDVAQLTVAFAKLRITAPRCRQQQGKSKFLELPAELMNSVLMMIYRKKDQAALARVCKRMHALLLPMLTHTVTIDFNDEARVDSFLAQTSGHQHLRHLTVIPVSDDAKFRTGLLRVLDAIPDDSLRTFRCHTVSPSLREVFLTLALRQQNLENRLLIGDGPMEQVFRNVDRLVVKSHLAQLRRSREATILVDPVTLDSVRLEGQQFTRAQLLCLAMSPNLESLEFGWQIKTPKTSAPHIPVLWNLLDKDAPLSEYDRTEGEGLRDAGAAHRSRTKCKGRTLRSVILRAVGFLRYEPLGDSKGIGFLTSLILQDCSMCSNLLFAIVNQGGEIHFKNLVILDNGQTDPQRRSLRAALSALLAKFTGLRTLVASSATCAVPDSQAITKHCAMLKNLYVDCRLARGKPLHDEFLRVVCDSCRQLEQVALPFVLTAPFGCASHPSTPNEHANVSPALVKLQERLDLNQLLKLPKLVTVRAFDIRCHRTATIVPVSQGQLEWIAAIIARCFKGWGQKELSVIAFGRDERPDNPQAGPMRCYMVRNSKGSWRNDGESGVLAVSKAHAMAEETRSEILDIAHAKSEFLRFPRLK